MKTKIQQIGRELVEHSTTTDFSAHRGLIDELFPYIYEAARRMSYREICAYLEKAHGVKISAMTLSRAFRDEGKHWRRLADRIEPAARCFSRAHRVDWVQLLTNKDLFEGLRGHPPNLNSANLETEMESYLDAERMLEEEWFSFDESVIKECMLHISTRAAVEKAKEEGNSDDKQRKRRGGRKTARHD